MGMSKDRCPYNSFFGEKVMIKEKLSLIWGKFVNRETISYLIFGVLTTLVDWISYAVFRHNGMNYRMATICCQAAAILFAYVTNKIWVFRSFVFLLPHSHIGVHVCGDDRDGRRHGNQTGYDL